MKKSQYIQNQTDKHITGDQSVFRTISPLQVHVLLVGGSPVDRLDIQSLIERDQLPYKLSFVNTMAEGLACLQTAGIDVVLIETAVLHENGITWCKQIGNRPCIFIIPLDNLNTTLEIIEDGVFDYLIKDKPWRQLSLLPALVEKVLKQKHTAEQTQNQVEIIDQLEEMVLLLDNEGDVFFANPAVKTTLNFSSQELAGKPFGTVLVADPDRQKELQTLFSSLAKDVSLPLPDRFDLKMQRQDGASIWIAWSTSRLPRGGLICVGRNITSRKTGEVALKLAQTGLEKQVAERTKVLSRVVADLEKTITEHKITEDTLLFLTQHRWVVEGENFFHALARFLAKKLEMDYVCIDHLDGDGKSARTVAIYFDGKFEDNVAYTLKDTPCGDVVGKAICCFPRQVRHLFPRDVVLQEMVAESYVGTTLWSSSGQAIGLIAIIGRRPLANSHLAESILRLVADPTAAELEREKSQAVLKKWAQVFEHSEWGISVANDTKIFEMVNPAYARMHGYHMDELIGKPIELVYPSGVLPDLYKIDRMGEENVHHTFESTHLRKDGSTFPVQVDLTVVRNEGGQIQYSIANVQDFTERKSAESEIRHLSSFPRLNPIPILEARRDGKIIFANQAMFSALTRAGLTDPKAFLPLDMDVLLKIEKDNAETQYNREVSVGDTIFDETLHLEPEFGNLRLYAIDITERKRVEAALLAEHALLAQRVEERTEELSLANVELARTARLKDEFLASMSHELRTPLTGILGLTEALQLKIYGDLNEKQEISVHHIEDSGRHLLSLINDILDLSKIDAGKVVLDLRPVSIIDVCQSSLQMIKQISQKKHISVDLKIDYSIDFFQTDERRLKQILVNLLNNAVKFTPEHGSIGLEVLGDAINKRIKFIVWDTGIGIDPQDVELLFKPFVQLDASLSRKYEGTGLGLSLVLKMVELHGGGVTVESESGQGSRFIVVLPWQDTGKELPLNHSPVAAIQAEPSKPSPQSLILLVDDNELYLNILTDLLVSRNYRVIVGRNGEEGVRLTREKLPDIILMDVQMPVLNGIQAAQKIRADKQIKKIPIIALTALAMNGDRKKCFQAGMNHYISKPVSIDELQKVIEDQLHLQETEPLSSTAFIANVV